VIPKHWEARSGDSNPKHQAIRNKGPIPEGEWWFNSSEIIWMGFDPWGPYAIPLHPESSTNTYGRSGFYIHGGPWRKTQGCIRLHNNDLETLVNILRRIPKRIIPLKVFYFY